VQQRNPEARAAMADRWGAFGIPTEPPKRVLTMDAWDAVNGLKPKVVVASWLTQKRCGDDPEIVREQSSVWGADEEKIIKRVDMYIHIGTEHSHQHKRILKYPHETIKLPGLVSRTKNGPLLGIIFIGRSPPRSTPCMMTL
jgi:hypothetical protein